MSTDNTCDFYKRYLEYCDTTEAKESADGHFTLFPPQEGVPLKEIFVGCFVSKVFDEEDQKLEEKQRGACYNKSLSILLWFPVEDQLRFISKWVNERDEFYSYYGRDMVIEVYKLVYILYDSLINKVPSTPLIHDYSSQDVKELESFIQTTRERLLECLTAKFQYNPKNKNEMREVRGKLYEIHHIFGFIPLIGERKWEVLEYLSKQPLNDECDQLMYGFIFYENLEELKEPWIKAHIEWETNCYLCPLDYSTGMGWQLETLFLRAEERGIYFVKDKRLHKHLDETLWIQRYVEAGGSPLPNHGDDQNN